MPERASPAASRSAAAGPALLALAVALVVLAPLHRGGNRPIALLVLELVAVVAIACLLLRSVAATFAPVPRTIRWAAAILLAYPLLQLVPLPFSIWSSLPGHEPYARVIAMLDEAPSWRALSLHPVATEFSWLALLPCVAAFLLAISLGRRQVRVLLLVFAGVALAEALLGILQTGAGRDSLLHLGNRFGGGAATGTYVNRNHFGALMAMALPVLVAIWASGAMPVRDAHGELLRTHPRHADARLARNLAWSLAIALVLAALLLSRSRAAIGIGLAAFGATSLVLVWSAATVQVRVALGAVAACALVLAAYAGLTPVVERFGVDDLSLGYEGRARLSAAAFRAGLEFLPFGSGLGTFADAFQRHQGDQLVGYIDHAHNDYAEAFVELGVAGLVAIALVAAAIAARWRAIAQGRVSRSLRTVQLAAGFSVLAMAAHGAFDFNFHIPANAIYFSLLLGVFLHDPGGESRA